MNACNSNDCQINNGGCDVLTSCTDVPGGRTCGACPSGYTGTGATNCTLVVPLTITTASPLPKGISGVAYRITLAANGGTTHYAEDYTWSITSGALPAWAALDPSTGVISGTPTAAGTTTFTVEVTDSASKTATKMFSLTAVPAANQVTRTNSNTSTDNQVFITAGIADGTLGPNRQMFLNNLDYLTDIQLAVGGMMASRPDTLNVKISDACGNLVATASQGFNNSGLSTPTSWKWVDVSFGHVALVYDQYYYLDVSIAQSASDNAQLVANTDRYQGGRLSSTGSHHVVFPQKKQDLMFTISGTGDSSEAVSPTETTNMACPSRCLLANPSGVENISGAPRNHFNLLIREQNVDGPYSPGSFWTDYNTSGAIPVLKNEIAHMLQASAPAGVEKVKPYNNYFSNMNFYVAIEDPSVDPTTGGGQYYAGFHHCSNIDAIIDVVDGAFGDVAILGGFEGGVARSGPNTSGWGSRMSGTLDHEVFGHGIAGLDDEYVSPDGNLSQPYSGVYMPNSLPISSGCSEWCGGIQPVSWLVSQMQTNKDPDYPCWSAARQSGSGACVSSSNPTCLWIGNLPAIPYWGNYRCIPRNAANYDVGINCFSYGNHGCYPLGADGSADIFVDVVQPNGSIMQSFHSISGQVPGFTSHVEQDISDVMDCEFNLQPCSISNSPRCTNLQNRNGIPGASGFFSYLQFGNDCDPDGTTSRRR